MLVYFQPLFSESNYNHLTYLKGQQLHWLKSAMLLALYIHSTPANSYVAWQKEPFSTLQTSTLPVRKDISVAWGNFKILNLPDEQSVKAGMCLLVIDNSGRFMWYLKVLIKSILQIGMHPAIGMDPFLTASSFVYSSYKWVLSLKIKWSEKSIITFPKLNS